MFEGIGKYILALFIIYLISYVIKKIELAKIFKKANEKKSKAYIPFLCTKKLIEISHSNPKLFKLTLIPFANILANIKIYEDMLKTFGQDPKEAPLYFFMPMVYFTKLGSGNARVQIHDYDINNEYLENQSILYEPVTGEEEKPLYDMTDPGYYVPEKKEERIIYKVSRKNNLNNPNQTILDVNNISVNQVSEVPELNQSGTSVFENNQENPIVENNLDSVLNSGPKTVFTDNSLEPDKRHERVVEAVKKEEVIKNPIVENITGRPKLCPKCGAKLAPGAQTCFLCGTKL